MIIAVGRCRDVSVGSVRGYLYDNGLVRDRYGVGQ